MEDFKVNAILNPKHISAASSINRDDLSTEFAEHAANVYYYAAKHGESIRQEMRAKQNLELVTARLDNAIRKEAALAKEKLTETVVLNRVKSSAEYKEALAIFNDATFIHNLAKGAALAMATKRDMLIQLGANEREEIKGSLRMADKTSDRALAAAGKGQQARQ